MTDKKNKLSAIDQAVRAFIHNLDALRGSMDVTMTIATFAHQIESEKHKKKLDEIGKLISETEKYRTYHIPLEHYRDAFNAGLKTQRARIAAKLLPRNFLVAFVSGFDAFLDKLISEMLRVCPDILNKSDRQLTYSDLARFASIDAARESLLNSAVESFMRESYIKQFDWMEKTFSVKLRDGLKSWPVLIELTERRHLFVHSDGKVGSQYLKVCLENNVSTEGLSLGSKLDVDRKYLIDAYKCIYEIGVKLAQVLWRKLLPKGLEDADSSLNMIAYDLLVEEKYELATRLLEFAVDVLPRHGCDRNRRMFVVNLAQAYKFSGRQDKCLERIDREDWSAAGDSFSICLQVLRDEFSEAAKTMERIGVHGEIDEFGYRDWPIFRKFRETEDFKCAFIKIFGKEPIAVQEQEKVQGKDSGTADTTGGVGSSERDSGGEERPPD